MTYESERLRILEMIDKGLISAEQGIELLDALQGQDEVPSLSSNIDLAAGDPLQPEVAASTQSTPEAEPEVSVEDLQPGGQTPYPEMMDPLIDGEAGGGFPCGSGLGSPLSAVS
jgi:hypothetical protein